MGGFPYHMMYGYPFAGMSIWMGIVWVIQLVVGYFVYRDAKERQMSPVLWFIVVIIPVIGWLFMVIYVIIRETEHRPSPQKESSEKILDERFAKGEITSEQYRQMKEELKK